ncbi:cyanophycinase [Roseateles chitinivorans]|uniref:Cyanophycinase n=1 Tax=Roseateles chitinivorans TaxID=2917965 RepID=A0A2G9C8J4_9BURK|nr:cyanophycinase [Roseateles chitinivorans]PIM52726.1 cyanophycinase [Roseateles chitinivorans]
MQDRHPSHGRGLLVPIGGNEDKTDQRRVLKAAVRAMVPPPGDEPPRVVVLTAASGEPERQWRSYCPAFEALGLRVDWLDLRSHGDAQDEHATAVLASAQLLFITGGDQMRLMRVLDGSACHRAILDRHRHHGLAIAGTSAGASVMGARMPGGTDEEHEEPHALFGPAPPAPHGLALLEGAVIDQHFTQRHRLARLLDLVSHGDGAWGLGIDEDTAAVISPDGGLSVVGRGAVTLIDCRRARRSGEGGAHVSLDGVAFQRAVSGVSLRWRTG